MKETLSYFACDWPDDPVPEGEPATMYYEVIVATDVVLRIVEVFSKSHATRRSATQAPETDPDCRTVSHRSLVHGPFQDAAEQACRHISEAAFQDVWERAQDSILR